MQPLKITVNGMQRQWKGIIEAAGRDHLFLSDPQTGQRLTNGRSRLCDF